MTRHRNHRSWLSGVAAAVLVAGASLATPPAAHAQPNPQQLLEKPNKVFTDSTGLRITTTLLRQKDPAYVAVEALYREGRITQAEYASLTQMRVESIGKMVGRLENWVGNNPGAKADEVFGSLMTASGKMIDAIETDGTTSAQLADATVDMIPASLRGVQNLIRDLDPLVTAAANDMADFGLALSAVIQSHPATDFSPSEKRIAADGARKLSDYVRLTLPSNMGTSQNQLSQTIKIFEDPVKSRKIKDKVAKDFDIAGGPDVVRRYAKAVVDGDEATIMETQTYMANMQAFDAMDHLGPMWAIDEGEETPEPGPVIDDTPRKPVKVGTYHGQDPYEGLYVPQAQQEEPVPQPKPVPKPVPKPKPKPKPVITPVIMNEIDPETGLPRSQVTHPEDHRGGEFDGDAFVLEDGIDIPGDLSDQIPYPRTVHIPGDGSFTVEGQSGYDVTEAYDETTGTVRRYRYVPGDGAFTIEGQSGYYVEEVDGQVLAGSTHHVPGDGSFTLEGQYGYDEPINENDPQRLSARQRDSAEDGDFSPEDAFSAAAAEEAINRSRQQIERQSDDADEAWREYAEQVYYDEEGNLHRITRPRPVNDYEAPVQDTRSATEIDRDNDASDPWHQFEPDNYGRGTEVAELLGIYEGYDIDNMAQGSSGRSLSSAGNSLSSAGNSMRIDWTLPGYGPSTAQLALDRANGMLIDAANEWHAPTDWGGDDIGDHAIRVNGSGRSTDPALASLNSLRDTPGYDALYDGLHPSLWSGETLAESNPDLARALYGPLWSDTPYRIQSGAGRQYGDFTSGIDVATLSGLSPSQLRMLTANDTGGLDRLLAQPFNVLLTWGAGAYDLDLHMTGPLVEGSDDRFHIYFSAKGQLDGAPYAELIKDCICNSGSEVILTSALNKGQVYRISVFNYGNQSAGSTNLSTASDAVLQIVRGGVATSTGDGTTIVGGHTIYTGQPTPGEAGNTWVAVEIDPKTGKIRAPNTVKQTEGSDNVH